MPDQENHMMSIPDIIRTRFLEALSQRVDFPEEVIDSLKDALPPGTAPGVDAVIRALRPDQKRDVDETS